MGYGSKNARQIAALIGDLRAFKVGNMKAAWYPGGEAVPVGMLSAGHAEAIRHIAPAGLPIYVVFSYSTPIAWRCAGHQNAGQWQAPKVWYSVTTTQHQALAAQGMREWERKQEKALNAIR